MRDILRYVGISQLVLFEVQREARMFIFHALIWLWQMRFAILECVFGLVYSTSALLLLSFDGNVLSDYVPI